MMKHLIRTVCSYAQAGLKRFASVRTTLVRYDAFLLSGVTENKVQFADLPAYPAFDTHAERGTHSLGALEKSVRDLSVSLSGLFSTSAYDNVTRQDVTGRRAADPVVSEFLFESQTASQEVDCDLFDAINSSQDATERTTGERAMRQLIAAEFVRSAGLSGRSFGHYEFRRGGNPMLNGAYL